MLAGILILVTIVILAMGYMYFAKYLASSLFVSTRDSQFRLDRHAWLYLGHHVSATAGTTAIIGVGIAAYWGWTPVFLWLVLGASLLGGVFAIGSIWLCQELNETDPAIMATRFTSGSIALPVYAVIGLLLMCLAPVMLSVIQGILTAYPGSIWPFALLVPMSMLCGSVSRRQVTAAVIAFFAISSLILVTISFVGTFYPLTFASSLTIIVADAAALNLGSNEFWLVLILFLAFFGASQNLARLAQPRGVLLLFMLVALIVIVLFATLIASPETGAESWRTAPDYSPIPWLPIVVTGGVCAAFHSIIAGTSLTLRSGSVAPKFGYLASAIDGILAVVVVVAASSIVAGVNFWESSVSSWPDAVALDQWPIMFVEHVAALSEEIGIGADWAATFTAFLVAALALAALEVCVGIMHYLMGELGDRAGMTSVGRHGRTVVFVLILIGYYLLDGLRSGTDGWRFVGILTQLFVGTMLVIFYLAVSKRRALSRYFSVPGFALIAFSIWAVILHLPESWQSDQPTWAVVDLGVLAIGIWLAVLLGRAASSQVKASAATDK